MTAAASETFPAMLTRLRTARGISRSRLGMMSLAGASSIHRLESGERGAPMATTLDAIANALNLTDDERRDLFDCAIRTRHEDCMAQVDIYRKVLDTIDERRRAGWKGEAS